MEETNPQASRAAILEEDAPLPPAEPNGKANGHAEVPCLFCAKNPRKSDHSDYCMGCFQKRLDGVKLQPIINADGTPIKTCRCGKQTKPDSSYCEECNKKITRAARIADKRKHKPQCQTCGKNPILDEGETECFECRSDKVMREVEESERKRIARQSAEAVPKVGEYRFHTEESDDGENVTIVTIRMSEIKTEKLEWLWQDRIPSGNITLFGGQPGCGKSIVLLDIIARATTGREWADGSPNTLGARDVLLLASEDGEADTIKPRLIAAEADMTRIHFVRRVLIESKDKSAKRKRALQLSHDIRRLKNALKAHPEVALVALDPISAFFGDVDPNKDKQIRPVMEGICSASITSQYPT